MDEISSNFGVNSYLSTRAALCREHNDDFVKLIAKLILGQESLLTNLPEKLLDSMNTNMWQGFNSAKEAISQNNLIWKLIKHLFEI